MKIIRYLLWIFVLVAVLGLGWVYYNGANSPTQLQKISTKLGAPFSLLDHNGNTITDKDLIGKPFAMFFGFTNCPDVCPTTLQEFSTWYATLGEDGDNLNTYFVTVDPERDTVKFLSEYVSSFDKRITGITGPLDKVEAMLRSYKVYWKKVPLDDGDYTMDHTATIYLFDRTGKFAGTIAYGENEEVALQKLKRLIAR